MATLRYVKTLEQVQKAKESDPEFLPQYRAFDSFCV